MQIAVHWQDADSSSANAVTEAFPEAEIMICGGHAARAHRKQLEMHSKQKVFTDTKIGKYKRQFPEVSSVRCHCSRNHKSGCGCLSPAFIAKAHTDFTSIFMACDSQEEFSRRSWPCPNMRVMNTSGREGDVTSAHCVSALIQSVRTKSRYSVMEGCTTPDASSRVPSTRWLMISSAIKEQSKQNNSVFKQGHLNSLEASHDILIRFKSKDVFLERLHYQLSTNLGLLQANLTYMHGKFGTHYHWIPELYKRLKLPVFDDVQALERYSSQRRKLSIEKAKTEKQKKRRVQLKKARAKESQAKSGQRSMVTTHTVMTVMTLSVPLNLQV